MVTVSNGSDGHNEPDDYLMELMGLKKDFPDEASDAYGEIYRRYWAGMFTIAKGVAANEDDAMDLLADTFNMVYKKAHTFSKGKVRTPQNIRFCIQKWMTTIMQRIYHDNYLPEEYRNESEPVSEDSYIIGNIGTSKHLQDAYEGFVLQLEAEDRAHNAAGITASTESSGQDSENLRQVRSYINKLPEREKDIVLTTYNYYVPGKYTPTQVLDDLEKKWGTTRENIRKILEKFRKTIKEELQPKMYIRK